MKLPPYGKPLRDLLATNKKPSNSVYLFTGQKAWERGKSSSLIRSTRTLILPPGTVPSQYDWPVSGCEILLIETSFTEAEDRNQLADLLFIYGAIKIISISIVNNFSTTYFKKDF